LLTEKGRIAVFAAPLYYSSAGSHLKVLPWEHLHESPSELRKKATDYEWQEFTTGLNEMTVIDFLGAVREAGLVLLDFRIHPDRNVNQLEKYLPKLKPYPMDLAAEGISALMCFPENL
jgi:hypothetical protein